MVNAMLCRIHLSCDLGRAAPAVRAQVESGIKLYKNVLRPAAPESIPFYPLGMADMTNTLSPVALGMRSPHATFIAVWRREGANRVEIRTSGEQYRLLYPTDLGVEAQNGGGSVVVTLPRPNMACIIAT